MSNSRLKTASVSWINLTNLFGAEENMRLNLIIVLWMVFVLGGCDVLSPIYSPIPQPRISPEPYPTSKQVAEEPSVYNRSKKKPPVIHEALVSVDAKNRLNRLKRELGKYDIVEVHRSLKSLEAEKGQRQFVELLAGAALLVDEIYKYQIHPNNLIFQKQLDNSGLQEEKEIYRRYLSPWCQVDTHEDCNAIASTPRKIFGQIYWPLGFTQNDFLQVSTLINERELMSPYSLVQHNTQGRLHAVPYIRDHRFGPLFEQLSQCFDRAAGVAQPNAKPLLDELIKVASSADIFSMAQNEQTLLGRAGQWGVYFGGFDMRLDRFGVKPSFSFMLSRQYAQMNSILEPYQTTYGALFGEYRQLFKGILDEQNPSNDFPNISIDEIWLQGGAARMHRDSVKIIRLPHLEGIEKIIVSVDEADVHKEQLQQLLTYFSLPNHISVDTILLNEVAKRLMHGFVPSKEALVNMPLIKNVTQKKVFGQHMGFVRSLLVEVACFWFLDSAQLAPSVPRNDIEQQVAAHMAHMIFTLIQANSAYQETYWWLLAWYFEHDAITFDKVSSGLKFDGKSVLSASVKLQQVLVEQISKGDANAIHSFVSRYGKRGFVHKSSSNSVKLLHAVLSKGATLKKESTPLLKYVVR